MTQDQWLILALKIATICGFLSLIGWVVLYTVLAKWWRSSIGRTLVAKTLLIAGILLPYGLSLFFNLNRLDSHIVGWADAVLIALITPVMIWRAAVWLKVYRKRDGEEGGV